MTGQSLNSKRPRLRYYVVRKGRGYFELGKARAEASGLPASEPLGPDGPEAWRRAAACYEHFKASRYRDEPIGPIVVLPKEAGPRLQWLLDNRDYAGDECLVPPHRAIGASGYVFVRCNGQEIGAHRLMLLLTDRGGWFKRAQAAHKCGNQSCCNPRHLYWATPRMNSLDRRQHGTTQIGRRSQAA